jgi:hypothetical protein
MYGQCMLTSEHLSPSRPRKRGKPLQYARALLAQTDPDKGFAAVILIDALQTDDLSTRMEAADLLASLGNDALVPLLKAWNDDDFELCRLFMITLGKIGPDAAVAVPLLQTAKTHPLLAPYATRALDQIEPPVLRPLVEQLRSPWTWSRLLDWLLFLLTHPFATFLSLVGTVLSVVHYSWEMSATAGAAAGISTSVSASFGLLGACIGGTLGAKMEGFSGAHSGAKMGGLCGSVVGLFVGAAIGTIVQPLVGALTGI